MDIVRELLSFYNFPGDDILIVRGSALAAASGGDAKIGKEAILKLMDAVSSHTHTHIYIYIYIHTCIHAWLCSYIMFVCLISLLTLYCMNVCMHRWKLVSPLPRERPRSHSSCLWRTPSQSPAEAPWPPVASSRVSSRPARTSRSSASSTRREPLALVGWIHHTMYVY